MIEYGKEKQDTVAYFTVSVNYPKNSFQRALVLLYNAVVEIGSRLLFEKNTSHCSCCR